MGLFVIGLFQKIQEQTKALVFVFVFVFVLVDEQAISTSGYFLLRSKALCNQDVNRSVNGCLLNSASSLLKAPEYFGCGR